MGFVGGIIQHLDLKELPRIIEFAYGAKQAFGHVNFIKNRQLHRHFGQPFELMQRLRRAPLIL